MPELSERCRVKSLGIFGSYVRGEAKRGSDLFGSSLFHVANLK
jgi:predicted nucleotidyltransferase